MSTPAPDLPDWTRVSAVIDSPQVLYSSGVNKALPFTTPVIDVSRFRSVRYAFNTEPGTGVVVARLINDWGMPGAVDIFDEYTIWPSDQPDATATSPVIYDRVKGNTLQSTVKQYASGGAAQLVIIGSLLDQAAPDTLWQDIVSSEVLAAGNTGTMASGAKQDYYSGPYVGNVTLSLESAGSSFEAFLIGQYDDGAAVIGVNLGVLIAASGAKSTATFAAAGMALDLTMFNSGSASGNCSFSLVKAH